MSKLERTLALFFPRAVLRRAETRHRLRALESRSRALEQLERGASSALQLELRRFEAGALTARTDGWVAAMGSPNAELAPSLDRLRGRSRDLVQNNAYAGRAVSVISTRTVGSGLKAKLRVRGVRRGQQPSARQQRLRAQAEELWNDWANTTDVDPEGRGTFGCLQSTGIREMVGAGEFLVRRRFRRASDGLAVPLQLQFLEPDHLDTSRNEQRGQNIVLQGVEYDALGRRVAYWLFPEHPGETGVVPRSFTSQRVPARDVLHVFRSDRHGQVRGVVWGAPVLLTLRSFDLYRDAQLMRQRVAACFAAFVHDIDGEPPDPVAGGAKSAEGFDIERIEPATVEYLPDGKSITFANPPGVPDFEAYSRVTLQQVAAGFEVPYEALTGDLSRVNFHSGRLGAVEFHAMVQTWQECIVVPQLCARVFAWFLEAATLNSQLPTEAQRDLRARWTPPKRQLTDPAREVAAQRLQVRSGLRTLSEVLRSEGFDPEEVFEEYGHDLERLRELGLSVESVLGTSSSSEPGEGEEPDEESPLARMSRALEQALEDGTPADELLGELRTALGEPATNGHAGRG